jgi:hypothetical protein
VDLADQTDGTMHLAGAFAAYVRATGDSAPGYDNDGDRYGATGDEVFSKRTNK